MENLWCDAHPCSHQKMVYKPHNGILYTSYIHVVWNNLSDLADCCIAITSWPYGRHRGIVHVSEPFFPPTACAWYLWSIRHCRQSLMLRHFQAYIIIYNMIYVTFLLTQASAQWSWRICWGAIADLVRRLRFKALTVMKLNKVPLRWAKIRRQVDLTNRRSWTIWRVWRDNFSYLSYDFWLFLVQFNTQWTRRKRKTSICHLPAERLSRCNLANEKQERVLLMCCSRPSLAQRGFPSIFDFSIHHTSHDSYHRHYALVVQALMLILAGP